MGGPHLSVIIEKERGGGEGASWVETSRGKELGFRIFPGYGDRDSSSRTIRRSCPPRSRCSCIIYFPQTYGLWTGQLPFRFGVLLVTPVTNSALSLFLSLFPSPSVFNLQFSTPDCLPSRFPPLFLLSTSRIARLFSLDLREPSRS